MVQNTLTTVNVDTASGDRGGPGGSGHELTLQGLVDPHQFKKDVWSMKRGEGIEGSTFVEPVSVSLGMDRSVDPTVEMTKAKSNSFFGGGKSAAPSANSDLAPLMVENNSLLKEQNSILKKILSKN